MSELSKEARGLLSRLGEADGPSSGQTARMKRNLGLALGAAGGLVVAGGATGVAKASAGLASAAGVAGGKASGTSFTSLLSLFALGAAAGVGVSTTTLAVRHYTSPPVSSVVASSLPGAGALTAPNATGMTAPPDVVAPRSDEPAAAPPAPAVRSPIQGGAAPAAPSSTPVEPTLGPELELVIAAKRELSQGRPAQALAIVERLGVEFPNGALREERWLLRVLSLCALGQVESARAQAREFAALAPHSPLLPRLEQSCGGQR
ncbi:MAG TPA: hypothetical protein VGK73_05880 [Polyangiaceae bacterium]